MLVKLVLEKFAPLEELQAYQQQLQAGSYGAMTSFVGTARDFNLNTAVKKLTLEHYPGMTEKQLQFIAEQACEKWELCDVLLIHRVGEIAVGEPIVLTAAWSAHRDASFAACRFMIDTLKTDAPFWKKELLADGERWVDK